MDINEYGVQNILSGVFQPNETELQAPQNTKQAFVVRLEGNAPGVQGIANNLVVQDFELIHDAILFDDLVGKDLADLDDNVESVTDTGEALIFNFMGGGSLTLNGVSGYNDFMSLAIDYHVEILS